MAVGGWSVKLYMNMDEVVAIVSWMRRKPAQLQEPSNIKRRLITGCIKSNGAGKAACRNSLGFCSLFVSLKIFRRSRQLLALAPIGKSAILQVDERDIMRFYIFLNQPNF